MIQSKRTLELVLTDTQGKLFELSFDQGLDSVDFIEKYMNSDVCAHFDLPFDHTQWAGEEYILASLLDENPVKCGKQFNREAMYWIGCVYREWQLITNEKSKCIYKQADANFMNMVYPGYHTISTQMAVERIKESKLPHNEN
ncbi:MAG: hypothetical protein LBE09_07000 [Christensenellaceae bacterium]|jgi:hypothetical protein|nr:hypothetical protein [Christensenellaceae bacterium]